MTNHSISFVFPGQGSQYVGMLSDLAGQFPEIKFTFDEASSVLDYDLWRLTQEGPADELDKTVHTQPALLAASYALWRVMVAKQATKPNALAGHSLGEYTALVCAEAVSFTDAIRLVALRGQFMQEAVAVGSGAMAAIIGLEEQVVADLCSTIATEHQAVLSPANFNSIGQVVIAGQREAVDAAMVLAKEKGAKLVVQLPVSVPSHCALMKPAAERLSVVLNEVALVKPTLTVINNVDVKPYHTAADIRDGLVRQLYMPVRWVETIQHLVGMGISTIVECGPGKVLTGLNKRIDKATEFELATSYINKIQTV